jgi:hypothetical protein
MNTCMQTCDATQKKLQQYRAWSLIGTHGKYQLVRTITEINY